MFDIESDMKNLKGKADAQRHIAKQQARSQKLEQERDWYRNECHTLDKLCKKQKLEIQKLRLQLDGNKEESGCAIIQLTKLKKQSKELIQENEQLRLKGIVQQQQPIYNQQF